MQGTVSVSEDARPGPDSGVDSRSPACVCTSGAGSDVDANVMQEPILEMYVAPSSFSSLGEEGLLDLSWEVEDLDVWDDDEIPAQAGGTLEASVCMYVCLRALYRAFI